uniref:NADH dehydrogenase subunit 6 n=1 Tax=Phalangium opilio TaxID=118624 RepID=B2CKZ3_PHAOP|nr:NADH dehydrogenase subunit 6 [Phalangium opilio]ACA66088.1 NADH dehydrogenase subunit 6 [Phalangium opilio]
MLLFMLTSLMLISMYTIHPLVIILSLISSVIIISVMTFMATKISLFGYMIILMLLGGLIILFIYMASIAPNEPIYTKHLKLLTLTSILITMMMKIFEEFYPLGSNKPNEIIMLLSNPTLITLSATYLFITLIAVVQITKIKSGPLRLQF